MMGTPWTPGPWKIGNADIYVNGRDGDDVVIAAIGQSAGFRSHSYSTVKAHKPEGKANTRLIAEAPAMAEVLEELISEFGCTIDQYNKIGPDWTHKDGTETFNVSKVIDRAPLIDTARAILARINGETP